MRLDSNADLMHTGAAAAWVDTVEKLGSGKLTMADVLAPAIRLAEEGYVRGHALLPHIVSSLSTRPYRL